MLLGHPDSAQSDSGQTTVPADRGSPGEADPRGGTMMTNRHEVHTLQEE